MGFGRVYPGVGQFAKWTQTVALLEVLHSAVGMFFPTLLDRGIFGDGDELRSKAN